jgi:HPt (histidine-containing phosphotransfer) domain-containing protein
MSAPVGTPLHNPAPVDEAVLVELVRQVGDDDGGFLDDLIGSYLAEAADQVARFATATQTDNPVSVATIAHALRSTSALLGATPLARLMEEAEQVALTTPGGIATLAGPVQVEFARVAEAFSALVSTRSSD